MNRTNKESVSYFVICFCRQDKSQSLAQSVPDNKAIKICKSIGVSKPRCDVSFGKRAGINFKLGENCLRSGRRREEFKLTAIKNKLWKINCTHAGKAIKIPDL